MIVYKTSEQVSKGHPDKMCDQISDAILDVCLRQDETSRVAVETMIKNNTVVVAGEITSQATLRVEEIVQTVLQDIGVEEVDKYHVINLLDTQSVDIAKGVDIGGAGDQGMMYGYATDETKNYMPLAWSLATRSLVLLQQKNYPLLKPDAKAQVTVAYENEKPIGIDTFLISTQHIEKATEQQVHEIVTEVMWETAKEFDMNLDFKRKINPTGRFIIGGSFSDTGLTGRKIIADTYGGEAHHGGGAFSGKDPTKVDRSGAYMARKIAKDIVKKKMASKCEVGLSYAIGLKEPISVSVDCFHTNQISLEEIIHYIQDNYMLTPEGIIQTLDLRHVNYLDTSTYGHFGKEQFSWEK